jgi:hypothetical protein
VARDVAALKFTAGRSPELPGAEDQLAAGRKYHDDWEAYERHKREPTSARDPITGTWKGTLESPDSPAKVDFIADLKLDAATMKVTGMLQAPASGGTAEPVEGTFDQGDLKLEQARPSKIEFAMKVQGPDHLKGTWSSAVRKGTVDCRREPPPVATTPEPKAPKKDEAMEPYRKLFAKEIPAIIVAAIFRRSEAPRGRSASTTRWR